MFSHVTFPETARIHHATKGKAERLSSALEAEYPRLTVTGFVDNDGVRIIRWDTEYDHPEEGKVEVLTSDKLPDLADILDQCIELDLDPEAGAEEGPSGSIVDPAYRQQYREASTNGQTCGDWLAEQLVTMTHTADGFNVEDFTAILSANGVDMTAKWATTERTKGWVGRYRMNGRQVLEKRIAWTGVLLDLNGSDVGVPTYALDALRDKHHNWMAKEAKRIAKQEAAEAEAAAKKGGEA